eukprot:5489095-Pleurochrysis_carterae.AAC.1
MLENSSATYRNARLAEWQLKKHSSDKFKQRFRHLPASHALTSGALTTMRSLPSAVSETVS